MIFLWKLNALLLVVTFFHEANFVRKVRVVEGHPAELGQWPWMAALAFREKNDQELLYACGGTLISNKHILTAASCIRRLYRYKLSDVRLGDLDFEESVQDNASPIDVPVDKIVVHPDFEFGSPSFLYNIAIVTLQHSVEFTKNIRPVLLPTSSEVKFKTGYIMGWGATEYFGQTSTLQDAKVTIFDTDTCKRQYAEDSITIIDKVISAGGDGKDTCQGDPGTPLIVQNEETFYVAGISSYGKRCGEYPGVYTKVGAFLSWIKDNMK